MTATQDQPHPLFPLSPLELRELLRRMSRDEAPQPVQKRHKSQLLTR